MADRKIKVCDFCDKEIKTTNRYVVECFVGGKEQPSKKDMCDECMPYNMAGKM